LKPLVTVGICVRNGEGMLANAVESIINQDFPLKQLQLVFVDDGSQDQTPKIISQYASTLNVQAKFFRTSWQGLGHARNIVVDNADGEFLLFVDADQVLTKKYVKTQTEVLQKKLEVGITAGVFKTVPGNLMLNLELTPHIVDQLKYNEPKNFVWKTEKIIGTGGTLFRVKALRQVNGFDSKIKGASEDTDLVLRIRKAGWLFCPNNAELYEFHGGLSKPRDLWRKYFWYGYGCQRTIRQTGDAFSVPRMSPIAGIVAGVFYSFPAYKFLRQKQVFLLPFHFGFKLAAWTCGFMKGQFKRSQNGFD
jgi:GT2 family glycosyltransferase